MSAAAEAARSQPDLKSGVLPLFENSPLALAICQAPGNIRAWNPALERMLGADGKNIQSLSFLDLIDADDRVEGQRLMAGLFAASRESFQLDCRVTGASTRPIRWTAWRIDGKAGASSIASTSILVMAQDLAAAGEVEERLRQAERLESVGRLAGGVAHDFNNLLTGVLLYCDLLLGSMEPLHRARHYAEEIRKAGLQATGLVRQLWAVARPTSSQPRPLSLHEIAEGMHGLLVRLIGENIELKQCLDPNLGLVKMDPTQAQQILLNLVLNARDAMPQAAPLR